MGVVACDTFLHLTEHIDGLMWTIRWSSRTWAIPRSKVSWRLPAYSGRLSLRALIKTLSLFGFGAAIAMEAIALPYSDEIDFLSSAEVAAAGRRTTTALVEAGSANREAEGLRQQNLLLDHDLMALRNESSPRRLNQHQRETLVSMLGRTPTPIGIVSRVIDGESSDFADDFDRALHDGAHWQTARIRTRISSRYGVWIGAMSQQLLDLPPSMLLDRALTAIRITHERRVIPPEEVRSTNPPFQDNALYLVIEQKPLPGTTRSAR